jgi:hypothetical protein
MEDAVFLALIGLLAAALTLAVWVWGKTAATAVPPHEIHAGPNRRPTGATGATDPFARKERSTYDD